MPNRPSPPRPSADAVARARRFCANPADFTHEPDFDELRHTAWWVLKSDQLARRAAMSDAAALRTFGPGDAA